MNQQINFRCTYQDHENEAIIGFCLNQTCQGKRKCCPLCLINRHTDHKQDFQTFTQLKSLIHNNYDQTTTWDKNIKDGFEKIKNISDCIIKFLWGEKNFLIELEQNLQIKNYEVQIHELLKLKSLNHVIASYIHQLKGDSFLEVLLEKIDYLAETFLGNENKLSRINKLYSTMKISQQMQQIRITNNNLQKRQVDSWIYYASLLEGFIQQDQIERCDIESIQMIIKDQAQIISQWLQNLLRAFELVKKTKTRLESQIENEVKALDALRKCLKDEQYNEMCAKLETFRRQIVPHVPSNQSFEFLQGVIDKLEQFYKAIINMRDRIDEQNRDFLDRRAQLRNQNIQDTQQQQNPLHNLAEQINNHQIGEFGLVYTQTCKNQGHENEQIIGYCFLKDCQKKNQCCAKCLIMKHEHSTHTEYFKTIFDTKNLVENQIQEIIRQKQKVDDFFQNFQLVFQNIKTILENQKTTLVKLKNNIITPFNLFNYLNEFKMLKQLNFIILSNLHKIESQSLLSKYYLIKRFIKQSLFFIRSSVKVRKRRKLVFLINILESKFTNKNTKQQHKLLLLIYILETIIELIN